MPDFQQRYQPVQNNTIRYDVSKTLFLGLGGSGKEVLLRLRRLFYTNIRKTGLPINQYLWIDTDPRDQNIKGQDYDEISKALYFDSNEVINAEVLDQSVSEYYNNEQKYGHIFNWMHPSIKSLGPKILTNGAGMIPSCGRLAFFHHYRTIKNVLNNKLNLLDNVANVTLTQNKYSFANIGNTKNVIIAASIAGGTGAGMLLDTAFLLKSIDSNITITGILFLPSVFNDLNEFKSQLYANGYALLMHLDYYMSPKVGVQLHNGQTYSKFTFNWDGTDNRVDSPPFYTLYLLGRENKSGARLGDYTEAFQMAAESIYLEFSNSGFGGMKRSIRVNLQNSLLNETVYTASNTSGEVFCQYFPAPYSSFGLSFIKLDIDRKRNAAAYFFGKSLFEHWKESNVKLDGVNIEVKVALKIEGTEDRTWDHNTIKSYMLSDFDTEKNFLDVHIDRIINDFNNIETTINKEFNSHNIVKGKYQFYEEYLSAFSKSIEDKIKKLWEDKLKEADQTLNTSGTDYNKIDRLAEQCLRKIKLSFSRQFYTLISRPGKSDGKAGIGWAEEFLKMYEEELDSINSKYISKNQPLRDCNISISRVESDDSLNKVTQYLKQAKSIKAPGFHKTSVHHFQKELESVLDQYLHKEKENLIKLLTKIKKELINFYEIRFHNFIREKLTTILKEVNTVIQNKEKQLSVYKTNLSDFIEKEASMFEAYNSIKQYDRHHTISQVADKSWYQEMIQKAIKDLRQSGGTANWEEILDTETDNLFRVLFENELQNSSNIRFDGYERMFKIITDQSHNLSQWRRIYNHIEKFCFKSMEKFLFKTDAEQEFRKSQDNNIQSVIKKMAGLSDIWLKKGNMNITPKLTTGIGVPSINNDQTGQNVKATNTGFTNAGLFNHEKGNIVLYSELSAFPLCYIDELKEFQAEYNIMASDLQEFYRRHLNYTMIPKLRNILPPENQKEAILLFQTGMIVLEALILDCLIVHNNTTPLTGQSLSIKPPRSKGGSTMYIGENLNQSIAVLAKAPDFVDILIIQIDDQKNKILNQGRNLLLEEFKVIDYYKEKVFPEIMRAGHMGPISFNSNCGLICDGLRNNLLKKVVKSGQYKDKNDSRLWRDVNKLKLEDITKELKFDDDEAHDKLLSLKE